MEAIMKKIMIIFIILIMLFEFSCSSNICYAIEPPSAETANELTSLMGGITAFVLWIPRIMAVTLSSAFVDIMTEGLAEQCGISDAAIFAGTEGDMATPFDVFFNKYTLLSVDFFDIDATGTNPINKIRVGVAQWYYAMRSISSIILLCVFVYVGIRMAISTVADEKAKYSKMLVDWVCSLFLIFLLQYIMIFTISANDVIVNFLRDVEYTDIKESINKIADMATKGTTIVSLVATFVYCMISFQTISFIITYIQRMLKVGFLIIIAPLISLTYSIDKMGDGKAQALGTWLKEFVYTILIQPFHCIMYLAFVNVAISLLNVPAPNIFYTIGNLFSTGQDSFNQLSNGFLVILCLKFINDGETAIRKIFNFQDDSSLTSMAAGAALGLAALTNAKKIGGTAAKGLNKFKGVKRITSAIKNDLKKFDIIGRLQNSKHFSKLGDALAVARDKGKEVKEAVKETKSKLDPMIERAKQIANKVKDNKVIKGCKGFYDKHGKKIVKFTGKVYRKSLPVALGMMGAAMSYATGSSGAMQAIGVGSGLNKASEEFFENSSGTLKNYKSDVNNKYVDSLRRRQDENSRNKLAQVLEARNMSLTDKEIAERCEDMWKAYRTLNAPDLKVGDSIVVNGQQRKVNEADVKKQQEDKEEAKKILPKALGGNPEDEALTEAIFERSKSITEEGRELFRKEELSADNISGLTLLKHGKSDIDKQKNEILAKIAIFKAKKNTRNGNNNEQTNHISDEDMESADAAMKAMTLAIDRNVIGGGGSVDMADLIKKHMGIESDSSEAYQAIAKSLYDYQDMKLAAEAEGIDKKASAAGIEQDELDRRAYRRTTTSM